MPSLPKARISITSGPSVPDIDWQFDAATIIQSQCCDTFAFHFQLLASIQTSFSHSSTMPLMRDAVRLRSPRNHIPECGIRAYPAIHQRPRCSALSSSRVIAAQQNVPARYPAPANRAGNASARAPKHGDPGFRSDPDRPLLHTVRFTIMSLILPIASVGFSSFGHTSTQFMMVWQRNRRYGSSRLSRRSLVSWSRVSAMKR